MTRRITESGPPAQNLTIRVYPEDRKRWEAAAKAAGRETLTEAIVRTMNQWASEVEKAQASQSKKGKP